VKRRAAFWFKTVAAAGVAIAVLLVGDTVFAYRYVGARIAHDQGLLEAVEEVSSLEHELSREHIDTIDGVQPLLRGILEDRSSEIAWISILAANGHVQASSGEIEPASLAGAISNPRSYRTARASFGRQEHFPWRGPDRSAADETAVPIGVARSVGSESGGSWDLFAGNRGFYSRSSRT